MNAIYVSDTNIWIDFRNAGLLESLFLLPFKLCCTDFVVDELDDFDVDALRRLGLLIHHTDERGLVALSSLISEHNNSSLADVSCYYLAKQENWPLLTGDAQLRKQAMLDGLSVHGALWLLDKMLDEKILTPSAAHRALTLMLGNKARLPRSECERRFISWSESG